MSDQIDKMSPAERVKLFEKLRAVQSLIEGGSTEGEISAAINQMSRLLTRYNLTEADLAGHAPDGTKVTHEWIDYSTAHRVFAWEQMLAWAVARSYYCAAMGTPNRHKETKELLRRQLVFIGRAVDVSIAKIVFLAVRARFISLANTRMNRYIELLRAEGVNASEVKGVNSIKTMRLSYLTGMAEAIRVRLEAQREKEATAESTALVLTREHEITEYAGGKIEGRTGSIPTLNQIMYGLGYQDGQEIDLAPPEEPEPELLALPPGA